MCPVSRRRVGFYGAELLSRGFTWHCQKKPRKGFFALYITEATMPYGFGDVGDVRLTSPRWERAKWFSGALLDRLRLDCLSRVEFLQALEHVLPSLTQMLEASERCFHPLLTILAGILETLKVG